MPFPNMPILSMLLALVGTTLALTVQYQFDQSPVKIQNLENNASGEDQSSCHSFTKSGGADYNLKSQETGASGRILQKFGVLKEIQGSGIVSPDDNNVGFEFFTGQEPCIGVPAFYFETWITWPDGKLQQANFDRALPKGQTQQDILTPTYFKAVRIADIEYFKIRSTIHMDNYIEYNGQIVPKFTASDIQADTEEYTVGPGSDQTFLRINNKKNEEIQRKGRNRNSMVKRTRV